MSDDQTFDEIIVTGTRELKAMSEYPTDFERLEAAEAEVERLTTELAEMTKDRDDWMACQEKSLGRLWVMQENYEAMKAAAEAREKALRAIPNAVRAGHSQPMQTHQAIDKINELMGKIE